MQSELQRAQKLHLHFISTLQLLQHHLEHQMNTTRHTNLSRLTLFFLNKGDFFWSTDSPQISALNYYAVTPFISGHGHLSILDIYGLSCSENFDFGSPFAHENQLRFFDLLCNRSARSQKKFSNWVVLKL